MGYFHVVNESGRDGIEWREEASQSDMDRV